jgi:hypothetical protein
LIIKVTRLSIAGSFINLNYSIVQVDGHELVSGRIGRPSYNAIVTLHADSRTKQAKLAGPVASRTAQGYNIESSSFFKVSCWGDQFSVPDLIAADPGNIQGNCYSVPTS